MTRSTSDGLSKAWLRHRPQSTANEAGSFSAHSRSNSMNRRAQASRASTRRSWRLLVARHHGAPVDTTSRTAWRHAASSGTPHAVTSPAGAMPGRPRPQTRKPSSPADFRIEGSKPSVPSKGAAARSYTLRAPLTGPRRRADPRLNLASAERAASREDSPSCPANVPGRNDSAKYSDTSEPETPGSTMRVLARAGPIRLRPAAAYPP